MKSSLLAGLVALLLVPVLAVPAAADSTYARVTGIDGVLYSGCSEHRYRYSVHDLPAGAGYWALEVTLHGSDGSVADTDRVVADLLSGTSTFFLCTPTDRPGRYTIRAVLEWQDAEEKWGQSQLDPAQFTLRKPRSRTGLALLTRRPAKRAVLAFRVAARDERPGGYVATPFTWVHLEKRVAGRWKRIRGARAMTHSTGAVKVRVRLGKHRPVRVRAVTEPTDRYLRSVSAVLRLRR